MDQQIEKLKKQVPELGYEKYDGEESDLSVILFHADEVNLFSNINMIVVDNASFFTSTSNKKETNQNLDYLESYFKNPNPNTILVFRINHEKLDERKKIVKIAKEKGFLKECNGVQNLEKIVADLLEDYTITKGDIQYLLERVGTDLAILKQEIDKLKLYKIEDKTIQTEDITLLTSKNIDTNLFHLIDSIIMKNKKEAMECYQEMLKMGEEPIAILVLLANQFRMIYQVKRLFQRGYSEKQIAAELKVHWYPVRKTLGRMQEYREETLLEYIQKLADLDVSIKKGECDKFLFLELFLLNV